MKSKETLFLTGGKVYDGVDFIKADVQITDGIIAQISKPGSLSAQGTKIDCSELYLLPSFVDLHCHIRDPGNFEVEDVSSASLAALLGGFSLVVMMPNTEPPIDSIEVVNYLESKIKKDALIQILLSASLTKGRNGKTLSPFAELKDSGVSFFTDDGNCVERSDLIKQAMIIARAYDIVIAQHLEDSDLKGNGVVNEGKFSSITGLGGIDPIGELSMLSRDLFFATRYQISYHAQHITLKESVELIKKAKRANDKITCEVTPHHIYFDDSVIKSFDPLYKVNPPLRDKSDVKALLKALLLGDIDVIATDHAPHASFDKQKPFNQASFGMIGLQSAFSSVFTKLSQEVDCETALKIIANTMSINPARIVKAHSFGQPILEGNVANITVVDPSTTFVFSKDMIASKSFNSPFIGEKLTGRVQYVIHKGKLLVAEGKLR